MAHAVPRRDPLGRCLVTQLTWCRPWNRPHTHHVSSGMTKHVRATGAPAALVLMVLPSSCQHSGARKVDCLKG